MEQRHNIVIIGEAGSGKSTFINMCANYLCNTKFDGNTSNLTIAISTKHLPQTTNMGFPILASQYSNNDSYCKTTSCNIYSFTTSDKQVFNLMDTPGLPDAKTINSTDKTLDTILSAVKNLSYISAIVLVINGSLHATALSQVIPRIKTDLPSHINNMVVVFTNCSFETRNIEIASLPFSTRIVLHMNNYYFNANSNTWDKYGLNARKKQWNESMSVLKMLFKEFQRLHTYNITDFEKI